MLYVVCCMLYVVCCMLYGVATVYDVYDNDVSASKGLGERETSRLNVRGTSMFVCLFLY